MILYEHFMFAVGYVALIMLLVVVLGVGGLLLLMTVSIALITYYPIMLIQYLVNKFN